ncbi:MAG: ureidoglycolate lyase [Deltaproteobacteria bacterium]
MVIKAVPLTAAAFAPFGDVLDVSGTPDKVINEGWADRFHDRARLDFGPDGRAGISMFRARPRVFPYDFQMVERHPEGSQAFIPMSEHPFLVIVARNENGAPGAPLAFITSPGQGINYHRGTWHGVLTPLSEPGIFAVIDRIGPTPNLIEYRYQNPWRVGI